MSFRKIWDGILLGVWRWLETHVVDEFPERYPPVCFGCNLGNDDCRNCKLLHG